MIPFLVISGVSSLILVVMVVALARHVRLLAGSIRAFQKDVQPVIARLRSEAEQARTRMDRAAESVERLRPSDPRRPR